MKCLGWVAQPETIMTSIDQIIFGMALVAALESPRITHAVIYSSI